MYLNVLIFILLFGALQALLLAAFLIIRKKVQLYHIFLTAYLLVLLFQVAFKVLSKAWLFYTVQQTYILSYYLPYLYGPLVLFFVKYYLQKGSWRWVYLLHFIPFAVYFFIAAFVEHYGYVSGIIQATMQAIPRMVLQLIALSLYHLAALKTIKNTGQDQINNFQLSSRVQFLQKFVYTSLCLTSGIAAALCFLYLQFPHYQDIRWSFAVLTVFIYWISYQVLKKPEIFRVIQGSANPLRTEFIIPPLKVHHAPVKYSNSGLKEEEATRILNLLQKSMEVDKVYLDADLTIDALAERFSCQKHHLSQVLNEKLHRTFNDLVNEMRTCEAKRILSDPALDHYKISSVAYDAGFNSLSSFNDIFKKREGITPSRYRVVSRHIVEPQIRRV